MKKKSTKLASRVDAKCLSRVRLASWPVRAEVWKRGYASTAQVPHCPIDVKLIDCAMDSITSKALILAFDQLLMLILRRAERV